MAPSLNTHAAEFNVTSISTSISLLWLTERCEATTLAGANSFCASRGIFSLGLGTGAKAAGTNTSGSAMGRKAKSQVDKKGSVF